MAMITKKDYSLIRGHLTITIRNIEVLVEKSMSKHRPQEYLSEYDYWLSSLDLLRNCLYGCQYDYSGQIGIDCAVLELREDITNFIKVMRDIKAWELAYLDKAWKHLKLIEEILA